MASRRPLVRIEGDTRTLPEGDTLPVQIIEGAVADDDARLTDAREWTAETVSQAEAETRTATTRRAWTAQRVGQAIAAWWATVGTTVGKALVNLTNPSAIAFLRVNADNTVTARSATDFRADIGANSATNLTTGTLPAARFNDTAHGNRAGGSLHALATGSAHGFFSSTDFTKLAGIAPGATANTGTVTSVGLSVPTGFSVADSPVTGAGTLTLTFAAGYQGYTTAEATKLAGIADNANNYTLPAATATALGGIELFSNTVQAVAANAVSATAARTYGVQLNADGQAVVNVPWADTNTTYSGSTSITLSGTSFQRAALTGDVTASANSNATTIANNVVTNAKLADVATGTIKGRSAAGTGDPEDLTAAQVRTLLNVANGSTANQTDAYLLNRANHTGTQAHTTITGLGTAATADVTTVVLDSTPGRLLEVGWGNLGREALADSMTNLDNNNRNRFLLTRGYNQNNKPSWIGLRSHGVLTLPVNNDGGLQFTYSPGDSSNTIGIRTYYTGVFQPWTNLVTQEGLATVATTGAYSDLTGTPTLGTAASANVTTSATDATSGRVLTVGYGGLHVPTSMSDFSSLAAGRNRNAFFSSPFAPEDRPSTVNYYSGIVFGHNVASGYESMLVTGASDHDTGGALYLRNKVVDVWQPWRRILDDRSLVTGNEDTTASRIPTVGWVQSYTEGAVTNLGLGTAATANLTTSSYSTTNGEATKVGDYGLGIPPASPTIANNWDDIVTPGIHFVKNTANPGSTNSPLYGVPNAEFQVLVMGDSAAGNLVQVAFSAGLYNYIYYRTKMTNAWGQWHGIAFGSWLETLQNQINTKVTRVSAPTSASSSGTAGSVAYDANYFYVCTATNTWRRVALSSW